MCAYNHDFIILYFAERFSGLRVLCVFTVRTLSYSVICPSVRHALACRDQAGVMGLGMPA